MAVRLYEEIELKIESKKGMEVYPLRVKLELSKEDKKKIKAFKKTKESEYKDLNQASKDTKKIARQVSRLTEDLEDVEYSIEVCKDEKKMQELRASRHEMRVQLRKLEDREEKLSKEFDTSRYQESYEQIATDVAKKTFELNVVEDEKSGSLKRAMQKHGITYMVIVSELSRLIGEAKEKKSKRS